MAGAAGTLKRLTLELGGNDAAIVLEDVDPKEVAPKVYAGAMFNAGQACIAIKRLYVHDSIYGAVCDELGWLARETVVGDGLLVDTAGRGMTAAVVTPRFKHWCRIGRRSEEGNGPPGNQPVRHPNLKFQGRKGGISVVINHLRRFQFPVSGYILISRSASACSASGSVTWKNGVCLGSLVTTHVLRQRVPI
jgi:Aldehyde dehydrogenase family